MKYLSNIFIGCILVATGCSSVPQHYSSGLNYGKTEEFKKTPIHRVLVLPFEYDVGREAIIDEVTEAFAVELRKLGSFEVIFPTENRVALTFDQKIWNSGTIDLDTVLTLRRRYDADAIIFGNITHYRPYEPILLGVKVGMISTETGLVIWSADGVFDSNENEVAELVKEYFESTHQKNALYGWKLILLSMRRYSQFVASQITKTLQP
ncbi:MAG: hypothetical protein B6D34_01370 [Candidatus Brocadia sp. UTAMX1]|jgi:hypothetical protein|nr:MAG: hypothetical protein B6D34_01370 [Candidatus Brocadia sp. UTAMX1]